MKQLEWTKTTEDGCNVFRATGFDGQEYEVWEMYEATPNGAYALNVDGYERATGTLTSCRELADWLEQFD